MKMDYRDILRRIYQPEIGSIWKAPNNIWTNSFARNKLKEELVSSILEHTTRHGAIKGKTQETKTRYYNHIC